MFTLMPNHLHAIVRPAGQRTVSNVLQSLGSFTAHAILAQLKEERRADLLAFFATR